MIKQNQLEKALRAFTLDKIQAIKTLVDSDEPYIESAQIGETLGTASFGLGGVISSLVRTKIYGQPIVIIVAASENRQKLIKWNNKVASKKDVCIVIKKIMNDFLPELS